MLNKIIKLITIFLVISILIIASLPFSVSAEHIGTYTMCMNQPPADDYNGYVEVLFYDDVNEKYSVRTMWWYVIPKVKTDGAQESDTSWVNVNIANNKITLTASLGYADSTGVATFGYMWSGTHLYNCWSYSFEGSKSTEYYNANYRIISYRCYGNVGFFSDDLLDKSGAFTVLYDGENTQYNQLTQVISLITLLADNDELIINRLNTILNYTADIDKQLKSAVSLLTTIETDLDDVNAELDSIDSELDEIDLKLQSIIDILSSQEPQPDFESTDSAIEDTTNQMNNLESDYKINQSETNSALSLGTSFVSGTDMQAASIQVKNWIERVFNENTVYGGFILAALGLGVCFWIIGRKGWG